MFLDQRLFKTKMGSTLRDGVDDVVHKLYGAPRCGHTILTEVEWSEMN